MEETFFLIGYIILSIVVAVFFLRYFTNENNITIDDENETVQLGAFFLFITTVWPVFILLMITYGILKVIGKLVGLLLPKNN